MLQTLKYIQLLDLLHHLHNSNIGVSSIYRKWEFKRIRTVELMPIEFTHHLLSVKRFVNMGAVLLCRSLGPFILGLGRLTTFFQL